MSFQYHCCASCLCTQEFYGRIVPPCPRCGYPELKTREEYYRSMGVMRVQAPTAGAGVLL